MKNVYKIIIICLIIAICIFLLLVFIRPVLLKNNNLLIRINEEKGKNEKLSSEIEQYLSSKDNYHVLNAEYQKLSMELPQESDLSLLTNEFYEVAKYTDIEIRTLKYEEILIKVEEGKEKPLYKEIKIDLLASGNYYQILNFIKTVESVPRLVKIENILMQASGEDYESLLCYITAKTYFEENK